MTKKWIFPAIWVFIVLLFFLPAFKGNIPAPLDTIVGLYHPWKDVIWDNLTTGVPFKNFLITDPVRQQIPWRFLAINQLKKGNLFSWNPYSFSGTPLTANIQTAQFYPLNILFVFLPFTIAWTLIIVVAPLLGGIFIYFYLRFFKLNKLSCLLASLAFSFSGFFIAWLEWGTLTHVLLWLPLILLAKEKLLQKFTFKWSLVLVVAEVSQLTAGHLQTSLYVLGFSSIYLVIRIFQQTKNIVKKSTPFILIGICVAVLVSWQYYPLIRLISLSAREYDLPDWNTSSWFLPWQHLIQFIVPDFFGNPATLNYFGEWNYGEFIGYVGIIPLIFSCLSILTRKDKKTRFFSAALAVTMLFILPNPISKLPFIFNAPFLQTAQPTRLLSIVVFCLSVLCALGLDLYLKNQKKLEKSLYLILLFFSFILLISWGLVFSGILQKVTRNNLILPSLLLFLSFVLLYVQSKSKNKLIIYLILLLAAFDLLRFGTKFNSFSKMSWFYPQTQITRFLTNQKESFRFMSLDRRIFPPNFSAVYGLEDVSGYDPLYLLSYAKLSQAWTSNSPSISPGRFNRIITPQNYNSFIADLLNVKYVLSLNDIDSPKLKLQLKEGETRVYENSSVFPRAYFVENVIKAKNEQEEIDLMFTLTDGLKKTAVSQANITVTPAKLAENETVEIISKEPNLILLRTNSKFKRFLVLSEINYPSWKVYIDNKKDIIYTANLALRGVIVPQGQHIIQFKYEEI